MPYKVTHLALQSLGTPVVLTIHFLPRAKCRLTSSAVRQFIDGTSSICSMVPYLGGHGSTTCLHSCLCTLHFIMATSLVHL